MHVTKMHLAFLNSIGKKGNNPKLANTVIEIIKTHARIQEAQQKERTEQVLKGLQC